MTREIYKHVIHATLHWFIFLSFFGGRYEGADRAPETRIPSLDGLISRKHPPSVRMQRGTPDRLTPSHSVGPRRIATVVQVLRTAIIRHIVLAVPAVTLTAHTITRPSIVF